MIIAVPPDVTSYILSDLRYYTHCMRRAGSSSGLSVWSHTSTSFFLSGRGMSQQQCRPRCQSGQHEAFIYTFAGNKAKEKRLWAPSCRLAVESIYIPRILSSRAVSKVGILLLRSSVRVLFKCCLAFGWNSLIDKRHQGKVEPFHEMSKLVDFFVSGVSL